MADLDGSFLDEHAEDALLAGPDDDASTGMGLQSPGVDETGVEDAELEAIKARVQEMEEEAEKLKELQNEVEKQMNMTSPPPAAPPSLEDKQEADNRSVYVGNVDYSTTAEELESHFHGCGSINRVTILCDKFTGHPKGFAYVEFTEKDMVQTALMLNDSLFKGRQIKVNAKRTNRPGISTTDRPGRARFRGAGRSTYRGGYSPYANTYGGYSRPRRFRPRRYTRYSPY